MVDVSTYTTVKDSGIDWIGDIPESWNVRTIYQLASQVKCKNSDLRENNLLSLSYGKIKRKDINAPEGLLPASFDGYNIIEAGDVVLRLTDLQNDHTSLRVGLSTERGIITSAYTTLRPISIRNSKYIYYLLHAFDLKKGFYGMGSGVRQGLNYDEVKELRVVLPSEIEQEAITTYLDNQCGQIDSTIEEAKTSIEEYKAWKVSIIYEVVTKGLDPTVEMKDSGIQWIGEIPWSWKRAKLLHCFLLIGSGTTPKSEVSDYYSGNIPWLQSGDINGGEVYYTSKLISEVAVNDCSALKIYKAPFIAVAMYGASIANTSIVKIDACTNQACCVLSCIKNQYDLHYLFYAILASKQELLLSARGGTQPNINQDIVKNLIVPTPDYDEQKEIASFLNERCEALDDIISEKQALISDLAAYKKSLIYETVTGKRKVV